MHYSPRIVDLGQLLLLQVAIFCAASTWYAIRGAGYVSAFAALNGAFAAIAGAAWAWAPATWPPIVAAFAVIVVVPLVAQISLAWVPWRFARLRYVLVSIWYLLLPVADRRGPWAFARANWLRQAGRADEADGVLASQPAAALVARIQEIYEEQRWPDLVDAVERWKAAEPDWDAPVIGPYLRALGETGRLDRLTQVFVEAEPWLRRSDRATAALCELMMVAFCGRRDLVERLFAGPAREHAETRPFWLATAAAAAGDRTELDALEGTLTDRQRVTLARRTWAPPSVVQELDTHAAAALARIDAHLADEASHGYMHGAAAHPIGTYVSIAVLVLVHLAARLDGAESWLRAGWFWAPAIRRGEWWRLATAGVLHAGEVHLAFNVLALWVFAPLVERMLGGVRFAWLCIGGSIGGLALELAVIELGLVSPLGPSVGASVAVMAVVGATIAISVRGALRDGSPIARTRVRSMASCVALQVVSDVITPQVSLVGHLCGVAAGVALGLVVAPRRP